MKRSRPDDARWGDAPLPDRAAAERLLSGARGYDPEVRVTLAEIEAAARGERRRRVFIGLPARWLAAAAAGVVLVTGGVALSRGWLARRESEARSIESRPANAVAHLERRRRLRTPLRGPAAVEEAPSVDGDVAQPEGAGAPSSPPALDEPAVRGPAPAPSPAAAPIRDSVVGPTASGVTLAAPPPARVLSRRSPPAPSRAWPSAPASSPVTGQPPPASSSAAAAVPSAPSRPFTSRLVPPAFEAPATLASPGGAETTVIRDALAQLRSARSPARALELIDAYDHRFPAGLWREEAAVVRIEALLALDRPREALERFDSLPQAALDRSLRLRVTRGELRARYGRCAEAQADFRAVLDVPAAEEIRVRARRGLAACATRARE